MAKAAGKKVHSFYIKVENGEWLKQIAYDRSTPSDRVTDDSVLDEILDAAREADKSKSSLPKNQKKSAVALQPATA